MRIAIIAWGSLIWDPRDLPREGNWQSGGPILPIEFSRISQDCRLTLVIDYENGALVSTRYVLSPRTNFNDAIEDLRAREGTLKERIGYVDLEQDADSAKDQANHQEACADIRKWLKGTYFEAAVWTALPSNFRDKTNRDFSVELALEYLRRLPRSANKQAMKYIRNAPKEVATPLRRKLLEANWIER